MSELYSRRASGWPPPPPLPLPLPPILAATARCPCQLHPHHTHAAEDVLAATGCRSFDALLCASLPSHGIASLSPSFTSLHKLCDLDVSGNLLADLSALAPLPSLRRLNVAGNCLALPWPAPDAGGSTRTPAGWFPSLEWLDLSYNQLEPEALLLLQRLPRLRELDISGARCGCKVVLLLSVLCAPSAEMLPCATHSTPLHSMPAGNALQALPALDGGAFSALHRLAAGHNDLADGALAALAGLPLLQQLVLQHNRVGELPLLPPAAFARLELLDVSHNRLADVAAVQRLQRLPSIQRLLLAGCPVARAGFGAAGTLAGTLHQAQAGAGRGGRGGPAGAGGSRAGKPSLAQTFQFSAVVEEASAVSLRAKGLARRGSTASSAAGTASMHSSATTSACPTRPGTGGPAEGGSVPATALPPAVPASVTAQPQADGSTTTKAGAEGGEAAAGVSLIDWPEDIDSSEGEGDSDSWHAQCADWSTGSAHGSGSTAGEVYRFRLAHRLQASIHIHLVWIESHGAAIQPARSIAAAFVVADDAMLSLEGDSSDDPTMRLALALGLDPLLLPAAGGPGMAGSPAAGGWHAW